MKFQKLNNSKGIASWLHILLCIKAVFSVSVSVTVAYETTTSDTIIELSQPNKNILGPSTTQISTCKSYLDPNSTQPDGEWLVPKILQAPMSQDRIEKLQNLYKIQNGELYRFELKEATISCGNGRERMKMHSITMNNLERGNETKPLNFTYAENKFYWTPEGYFKTSEKEYVSPDSYCIQAISETMVTVQVCDLNGDTIIPKCCPMGMAIKFNLSDVSQNFECVEIYFELLSLLPAHAQRRPTYVHTEVQSPFVYMAPQSDYGSELIKAQSRLQITDNGKVLPRRIGNLTWEELRVEEKYENIPYCVDALLGSARDSDFDRDETERAQDSLNQIVLLPYSDIMTKFFKMIPRRNVYLVLTLVARCICLAFYFVNAITYVLLWGKHNVHGWTTGAFLFATFVMGALLVALDWMLLFKFDTLINQGIEACVIGVDVGSFSWVSVITWMVIMNFDVWSTLRSKVSSRNRSKGKKRFGAYCVVGFGFPAAVLILLSVIRVNHPGGYSCYLLESFVTVLVILCLLSVLPFVFGCLTLITLYKIKKGTMMINNSSTKLSDSQIWTVLKLSLLMGFWVIVYFGLNAILDANVPWGSVIGNISDIIYSFSVFWIFVCNYEIKKKLSRKYKCIEDFFNWTHKFVCKTIKN